MYLNSKIIEKKGWMSAKVQSLEEYLIIKVAVNKYGIKKHAFIS
jgi:hypothetical protein